MKGCNWIAEMKTNWRCDLPGVRVQCPVTCDACCLDSEERYEVTIGTFAGKMKTCAWAGEKVRPRCNDPAAQEACPRACGTCPLVVEPTSTLAPVVVPTSTSTTVPTPATTTTTTSKPTQYYVWCRDSNKRFDVPSLWWINHKKNCDWAAKSNPWWKCKISEVRNNCPKVCRTCNCKNNQKRFKVNGKMRSCSWAAAEKTLWRCNNIDSVRRNCPLLCGECDVDNSPSVAPQSSNSQQPTTETRERLQAIEVVTTTKVTFDVLVIPPENSGELAAMKDSLAKAILPFLAEGATITNVELEYTASHTSRRGTIIGNVLLTILKIFGCNDEEALATTIPEAVARAIEEVENILKTGVEGGLRSPINTAVQETFIALERERGGEFIAIIGEAALGSIDTHFAKATKVDSTTSCSGGGGGGGGGAPSSPSSPTNSPTISGVSNLPPSIQESSPSSTPSSITSMNILSIQPSLVTSLFPTLTSSLLEPSEVPSIDPTGVMLSLEPSTSQ